MHEVYLIHFINYKLNVNTYTTEDGDAHWKQLLNSPLGQCADPEQHRITVYILKLAGFAR